MAVVVFGVVSFVLSWLRALEFQTSTWDMGLYQQAIWTSSHGRVFYENADLETGGYLSLLQVHSVLLFYLIVPLYAVFPFQTTLFAVQSAVVAAAAIPLYFLGKRLMSSAPAGLAAGLIYLAWAPTLSSTLYDFHPEAFLPLEIFALVLLWEHNRYSWAFVVAALAFCTLELAPVLIFFIGVFGLLCERGSDSEEPDSRPRGPRFSTVIARASQWLLRPKVRASLALMATSVVAYVALLYLRVDYLTMVLGTQPLAAPPSGYVIGATPAALQLSLSNVLVGLHQKLTYWLVVVALLGFVPLFAPRALVLVVPWLSFTLLSKEINYTTLGFQYGFIVACAMMVAFVYGLPTARCFVAWIGAWMSRRAPASCRARVVVDALRHRKGVLLAGGFVVLVAVNLALTPMNPYLDNRPYGGSAYRISYSLPSANAGVKKLVALMQSGATVVASDNLFPLVANDPNAYSFLWAQDPSLYLPFNLSHLPTYVLVSEDSLSAVTPWIAQAITNQSLFGVRGLVWSTSAGNVTLYEAFFTGTSSTFGLAPPS